MNWFWLSIVALLCWSGSDLFSKMGSRPDDRYSHWKMVMAVGLHPLKKKGQYFWLGLISVPLFVYGWLLIREEALMKQKEEEENRANELEEYRVYVQTKQYIEEIAKQKMPDLNAASLEAAMSMVAGTCRSMGVTVVD